MSRALHAIWSYNERWDFPRAGSSLFLPRFSGLTFLRFLGPFFIFSEIFASGVLYFLRWFFIFFQLLNEMKGTYMNNKKKSGCFRPIWFFWFQHFLEKAKVEIRNLFRFKSFKVGKKISRSLSPEISMLRRSLKVNLFFKSRILRAGSLFFSKIWGLVLYTTVLYRTILRVFICFLGVENC